MGNVFMKKCEDVFETSKKFLSEYKLKDDYDLLVVDFHGEITSEKNAIGHFFVMCSRSRQSLTVSSLVSGLGWYRVALTILIKFQHESVFFTVDMLETNTTATFLNRCPRDPCHSDISVAYSSSASLFSRAFVCPGSVVAGTLSCYACQYSGHFRPWISGCQPRFVLPSGIQQSTRAFSTRPIKRRLWTTARFWFSILPESTRERVLHNRYAGNQHHGNFF